MFFNRLYAALAVAFVLLVFAAPASAQVADPPYEAPGAQRAAEARFGYATLGLAPPPVGWACELVPYSDELPWLSDAVCVPDPDVAREQERERDRWLDRLEDRSRRTRQRLGLLRGRSR